jgi:tetratricopeptide (TPR) repeat protein
VYLLKEEPWEATLLYSQVERLQKDAPIGYEAKLRNAKLSYYKADFRLAQEHLDILKQATTREIANDAIDLSMRISENLGMDSLATELREYAAIELLMLQNKMDEALQRITAVTGSGLFTNEQLFLKNQVASSATSLMQDDFYWLEANLRLRRGEFNLSLALLQKIIDQFGDEILADDASFLQAEIYDVHLQQKDKAQELYREFLTRFAGSVYAAEARKRFRTLRGDFSLPVN